MTSTPILVTGGTGKTGSRIAQRLAARGIPVRIGSRSGQPSFDWNDPATWSDACDGVGAVYLSYYPDLAFPGAAETVAAFTDAAVQAGISRLVLLSGRGEEAAQVSEKTVLSASAEATVVRASWFHQNFSEHFLLGPVLDGLIALPGGDVAEPFVDVDDIADVAVAALTEPGHAGELYEVTGPRLLTFAQIAQELTVATGRAIRYVSISAEDYAAAAISQGVPAEEAHALAELFTTVLDGRNEHLTDGVQRALGRPPRDFAEYARATAATGVWNH